MGQICMYVAVCVLCQGELVYKDILYIICIYK